ncbi:PIN domain nuclease [Fimbriiglobus ruber]|uniref:type II toxin-antitoxin system VapC family toxin n=1 Tax=Fimbriiglobus ruber TaxID=1908690 RepID=UPI000B4B6DDB
MLILTDTGILIRLADPADPQHTTVDRAVRAIRGRGDGLAIGAQNAAEFWNVCTRPATARGGWGLTVAEADRRLKAVETGFPLLPELPTVYPIWRSLLITHSVQGKQVHDARLVALMTAPSITHILTLNAGDFARFPGIVEVAPASLIVSPPAPTLPSIP